MQKKTQILKVPRRKMRPYKIGYIDAPEADKHFYFGLSTLRLKKFLFLGKSKISIFFDKKYHTLICFFVESKFSNRRNIHYIITNFFEKYFWCPPKTA